MGALTRRHNLMTITIYHNPRCSKSRQALKLIKEHNIEPNIIEYLKTPPSAADIRDILKWLNLAPREIMRKGEPESQSLELGNPEISTDDLINAIVANPILMERPIVVSGNQAIIGRPPENILKIIS